MEKLASENKELEECLLLAAKERQVLENIFQEMEEDQKEMLGEIDLLHDEVMIYLFTLTDFIKSPEKSVFLRTVDLNSFLLPLRGTDKVSESGEPGFAPGSRKGFMGLEDN